MIIGYARVSTTEQNLGLRHDDLKPAFDASVDPTEARSAEPGGAALAATLPALEDSGTEVPADRTAAPPPASTLADGRNLFA